MQLRSKRTSLTIEELLGNGVFCVIRGETVFIYLFIYCKFTIYSIVYNKSNK
jgi:hypothetical protein